MRDGRHVVADMSTTIGCTDANGRSYVQTIATGTYRIFRVTDCNWERRTSSGAIIDNDFVTKAPDGLCVTNKVGAGFTSTG